MQSDRKKSRKKAIYFIVPAPLGISPGQRFRFEHYLSLLQVNNIKYKVSSFYTSTGWKNLYTPGNKLKKIASVLAGFLRRCADVFKLVSYSHIYIYREAAPIGPPLFEWVISKVLRKKIVYDFDDAIWIPVSSQYNKTISRLRNFGKTAKICKWACKISVGNKFLADYSSQYNTQVNIIPTVVDTGHVHNKLQQQMTDMPSIGWTGTFSTLKYLDIILPVLQELQASHAFKFVVIADKDPQLSLHNYQFIKWNKETESNDLLSFHIGLMPLYNDEISKGKCGFKAIQYMSLGIPAVVSPVGVNSEIVDHGVSGFICATEQEWKERLLQLLTQAKLREQMGIAARKKIQEHYSVESSVALFINLFN